MRAVEKRLRERVKYLESTNRDLEQDRKKFRDAYEQHYPQVLYWASAMCLNLSLLWMK